MSIRTKQRYDAPIGELLTLMPELNCLVTFSGDADIDDYEQGNNGDLIPMIPENPSGGY